MSSRVQSQDSDRLDMRFPLRCLASVLLLGLLGHQVNSASVKGDQPSLLNLDLASFLKDDQVASSRQLPDSTDSLAEPKVEQVMSAHVHVSIWGVAFSLLEACCCDIGVFLCAAKTWLGA